MQNFNKSTKESKEDVKQNLKVETTNKVLNSQRSITSTSLNTYKVWSEYHSPIMSQKNGQMKLYPTTPIGNNQNSLKTTGGKSSKTSVKIGEVNYMNRGS